MKNIDLKASDLTTGERDVVAKLLVSLGTRPGESHEAFWHLLRDIAAEAILNKGVIDEIILQQERDYSLPELDRIIDEWRPPS